MLISIMARSLVIQVGHHVGPPASTVTSLGMAMLELLRHITPKRTICRKIANFKI